MPTSVTLTGRTGPGRLLENHQIHDVHKVELDLDHQVVRVTSGGGETLELDMKISSAFKDEIKEGNHNIVIE